MTGAPSLVIGVGNRDRGDDAAGPAVCDRIHELSSGSIRTVVLEASAIDLVNHWDPGDQVVVVDAGRPAGEPGRITEYDGLVETFAVPGTASTHSIDVAGGVELARTIERTPAALTIISIEGGAFGFDAPLTEAVRRSVGQVAARLVAPEGSGSGTPDRSDHTGSA